MVLSMTIFGTIGAFVRWFSLSSGELALLRALMALLLIGGYLLIRGGKISLKLSKRTPISATLYLPATILQQEAHNLNGRLLICPKH
jgi:hypothetical protein